jgi:cephalosporin hydroxylase
MNYESTINNTDKFSGGFYNDGKKGHNYQLLIKNLLSKNVQKIMEIGTAHGGFAKFLKDNKIKSFLIGADISPDDPHPHVTDFTKYNNLYDVFYTGDAFCIDFLTWVEQNNYQSDLVIEDGDHDPRHQSFLLSNVNKLITKNGVYICEDVQTHEIALQLVNSVPSEYKKFTYIWDGRCSVGRYDDICVVVDRR